MTLAQSQRAKFPMNTAVSADDSVFVLLFCAFVVLGATSAPGSVAKYAIYTLPILAFVIGLLRYGRLTRLNSGPGLWIAFSIIGYSIVTAALLGVPTSDTWRETLLIALPYFVAAYVTRISDRNLTLIGVTLCAAIVVAMITGHAKEGQLSWSHSSSPGETAYSLPLTLVLLTLFMTGRKKLYQVIFAFFCAISMKRIAVAGLTIGALYYVVCQISLFAGGRRARVIMGMAAIGFFLLLATVGVNFPYYFMMLNHHIRMYNLSPEEVLQGRYFMQTYILNYDALHSTPLTSLIGHGIGRAPYLLGIAMGFTPPQALIHNDFLKMYFDGGYIFLFSYCLMLVYFYGRTNEQLALLCSQFCIFLTDNTLVYVFHISIMLFCLRYLRERDYGNVLAEYRSDRRPSGKRLESTTVGA